MTKQEIKEGIKLICETSKTIENCYNSKQFLVDEINRAKKEDIQKCWEYYQTRSGVIVDLRKELINHIIDGGSVTVELLDQLVEKHKAGKENQFKTYKNYYTIFYPAITFYGHESLRKFISQFIKQLIGDLDIGYEVKSISFDFQGARQLGSDRYWIAVYNKAQKNQSTSLQIFIEFFQGYINYGFYRHLDKTYLKEKISSTPEDFNYDVMVKYFKSDIELILNDIPDYGNLKVIELTENQKLYKISLGSFKQKSKSHIVDYLINSNYITLHENTQKDQSRAFREDLKSGDFVYITLGAKELIGIAQIATDECNYIPSDIIGEEGWLYREIEMLNVPIRKSPKDLKDKGVVFPSGNSTLALIKASVLNEVNEKLFNPYFNLEFTIGEKKVIMEKNYDFKAPINQILYGPPGTGKTYNTILKAARITTGNRHLTYDEAKKIFNEKLHDQIEFITFHQNYSYEDFIQGLRPETENGNELSFEKKDGVFKRIADRALANLKASEDPATHKRSFESVFNELIAPLNEEEATELEIKMKKTSFYITEVGEKSIAFRKNSGGTAHTLSITTLRKMYEKGSNEYIVGGLQPYYNPILELLLQKGKSQLTKVDRKNYVIVIDEINRANISRVFGELITLIEEDKRSHGEIPLYATLPSGDSFIVPSNLYIIGTMNTADKSIALLDIALRRRFEFEPLYPNHEIAGVKDGNILQRINEEIVSRKGHDFTIGHAYFMGEKYSLENTINLKVIPLLLEYFMNDYKEVTSILKSANIETEGWPLKMKL